MGDMSNFQFLEKGLEISPPHFVHGFSRKMFIILYYINWPSFIVWLPLLLKILDNMFTVVVRFPGLTLIKFEINLILLIEPNLYMAKK